MRSRDVVADALETKYLVSPVIGCCARISHIGADGKVKLLPASSGRTFMRKRAALARQTIGPLWPSLM